MSFILGKRALTFLEHWWLNLHAEVRGQGVHFHSECLRVCSNVTESDKVYTKSKDREGGGWGCFGFLC